MFDCVLPTRIARNGTAVLSSGQWLSVRQAAFRTDADHWSPDVVVTPAGISAGRTSGIS